MRKYLFKKETFIATTCVFLLIFSFSLLPVNTYIFDPIKSALKDVSFNDLGFYLRKNKNIAYEKDILIIDINGSNRTEISQIVKRISGSGPRVIGIDATFTNPGPDPTADSLLFYSVQSIPNIVTAFNIQVGDQTPIHSVLKIDTSRIGYINLIGESVIRHFSPFEVIEGKEYNSFAAAVTKVADPKAYEAFRKRNRSVEMINYRRTINNFIVISKDTILSGSFDSTYLRNKIVLLGYISHSADDINDKLITPMNNKFIGKTDPDMNGVIIHANIISMITSKDYISKVPFWVNLFIAILLNWLFMSIILQYFINVHIWFHLVSRAAQLIAAVIFVYLEVLIIQHFNLVFNFSITSIGFILAVDVLYFYEGIARWISRKFHKKTIFDKLH